MRSQGDGPRGASQEGPWEGGRGRRGVTLGPPGKVRGGGGGRTLWPLGKVQRGEGGDLGASGNDPKGGRGRSWEPVRSRKRPSLPISL